MKIVVIGGTGLIGSRVVQGLRDRGHEVIAASPNTGVNTITGEGLAEALSGAQVVVDVANSPDFADDAAMAFFTTAGRNLLTAEAEAGVSHHIALSVVGTERLQASGYFRAKLAQEDLIRAASTPWTILRSTQFFPFITGIIQSGSVGDEVHLPAALIQPVSADDVAAALVELALSDAANGVIEIAGPETIRLDAFASEYLAALEDRRSVIADTTTLYFGARLEDHTLTPGPNPLLGKDTLEDWLRQSITAD